jgi:catechol 2,3-dioxygenase-like lactoylglutathione lyase family enzyme
MRETRSLAIVALNCLIMLPVWAAVQRGSRSAQDDVPAAPALANVCLISKDVKRLVDFYEGVLQVKARWTGTDYAELTAGSTVLAIFSFEAQQKYIPGVTDAARNRSVILEFRVADADREYSRLRGLVRDWVKPPTTQPWGTRSIYFRDPDGDLVDFFVPPKIR